MFEVAICNSSYIDSETGIIPFGPLSVVASIENEGINVIFRDYQIYNIEKKPDPVSYARFLREIPCQHIGVNVMCGNLPTVLEAIKKIKDEEPERFIFLGGPSATDSAEFIMGNYPVDAIVKGEGEVTSSELVKALRDNQDFDSIQGLVFRKDGEIVVNSPRQRVENLDNLPFPALHHLDSEKYLSSLPIFSARGCPYKCVFCSAHSIWQRKLTYYSPKRIVEFIKQAPSFIKFLEFNDDTFLLDIDRVSKIVNAFEDSEIDLEWSCQGRIDRMTPELIQFLAEHNCTSIMYGVESGSNEVLRHVDKNFTVEDARRVIDMTNEKNIKQRLTYIWGFPFETLDDFYATLMELGLSKTIPRSEVQLYMLNPLKEAPITKKYAHLLKFSVEMNEMFSVNILPTTETTLRSYPLLIEAIKKYPELYTSFYYFDHPDLEEKVKIIQKINSAK